MELVGSTSAGKPEAELSKAVDRYWHCLAADLDAGLFDDVGRLVVHSHQTGLAAYRDWLQRHGPCAC